MVEKRRKTQDARPKQISCKKTQKIFQRGQKGTSENITRGNQSFIEMTAIYSLRIKFVVHPLHHCRGSDLFVAAFLIDY